MDTTAAIAGAIGGTHLGLAAISRKLARRLTDQGSWSFSDLPALASKCYDISTGSSPERYTVSERRAGEERFVIIDMIMERKKRIAFGPHDTQKLKGKKYSRCGIRATSQRHRDKAAKAEGTHTT